MSPSESCDLLCIDLPLAEAIRGDLPDRGALELLAEAASALGDPTRLELALALRAARELCVCDLAWITGRQDKLVSHHLRQLRAAGLASSRKDGRMVMYALTRRGTQLLETLTPLAEARGR